MSRPAVSIVLIVHNTAPWLDACFDSIAAQSFDDYELVVVDVASRLATKRVLARRWHSLQRARLIPFPRNVGGAVAGNTGIRRARGRYVFLMDSDDLLPPDALRVLHQAAERDQLDVAIGRGLSYIGKKPRALRYSADRVTWARPLVTDSLNEHPELTMAPYYWGRLYRAELLRRHRIEMRPGRIFADRYFTCGALKASRRTGVVDANTYYWRRDRATSTKSASITQQADSVELVRDRLASFDEVESLFDSSADVDLLAYVRASNLMRLLIHARSFARTVDESGADVLRRREFVELARPYAAGFSLADISGANFLLARHRVQWYLLSQGRDEDLATFLAKEPKVPVSRTEGDAQWYDYTSILPDLLPEVCWEPRRAIGQVAIGRVDTASRVLEVVAEIPAGMSIEPLHLVLRPRSPATSERLPVRTCALGRFAVDLAMDRLPDPLPPLALEYLAGGRVCVAPVSVDAVG